MIVRKKLIAGKAGAKKYLERYGDKLICVRYRYDEEKEEQLVTLELVVSRKPYPKGVRKRNIREHPNRYVLVKVEYHENELRQTIKNYGGVWLKDKRLWKLQYRKAEKLRISDRIQEHI